jgi:hypothetical protein
MSDERHGYAVKIPQDLSRPDKIMFGATARQIVVLGGAGVVLWLIWLGVQNFVPPLMFVAPAVLVLLLLGIAVTVERDGVSVDQLLMAAVRQAVRPHRRVMAPEGVVAPPTFLADALRGQNPRPPSALELPVQGVTGGGHIHLGDDGIALLAEASAVNFALRTPSEQELLVGGFARWLNSLTGPVQITSRMRPADLTDQIGRLRAAAPELPHPLLEAAAADHAEFLTRIGDTGCLLHRDLLLTVREPVARQAPRADRRLSDAASALSAAEITVKPLDASNATAVLSAALDPDAHPLNGS